MTFSRISRRRFLVRTGGLVEATAVAHALGDPLLRPLAGGQLWLPAAMANGDCFDAITDQTGWFKDGDEDFQSGTATAPLVIFDDAGVATTPGQRPYCTLYCPAHASLFDSDFRLAPSFSIDSGNSPAGNDTGVHLKINVDDADHGGHEIIVSLRDEGGILKLALVTGSDPGGGIPLVGRTATFEILREANSARLGNPKVFLRMNGQTREADVQNFSPPVSGRVNTIEFGTYDVPATSTTRWTTLGLPPRPAVLTASLDLDPNTINLKAKGPYITAYIESSAFDVSVIDVSTVTLQAISPVTSAQLHVATGSPTAVGDGNGNGVTDRMVKFDRATVQAWFPVSGEATFRVRGRLTDGRSFQGDGTGRIINAGVTHTDQADPASVQY